MTKKLKYFFFILTTLSCSEEIPETTETKKSGEAEIVSARVDGKDTILTLKYFYPSGKTKAIIEKTTYGHNHGFEKLFYENGILKQEVYIIGQMPWAVGDANTIDGKPLNAGNLAFGNGTYNLYYDDGTPKVKGKLKTGKTDSIWTFYYPNGQIERLVSWKEGFQHGLSKRYFETGQIEAEAEYFEGETTYEKHYYESGNLFKVLNYKNGLLSGECSEYYDDKNKIKQTRIYENGKENGIVKLFFRNGKISQLGKLKNGEPVDTLKMFDEKGKIIDTKIFTPKLSSKNSKTI